MGKGVNRVTILGNVGADPEVRYMPSGGAVVELSIATSEQWTDKNTNQKQERTEWHRVCFFNRLAEIVGEYVVKGAQLYVEGSIRTDKYQDKNTGEDRYSTKIIANNMQLLGRGSVQGRQASPQERQFAPVAGSMPDDAGGGFEDDIPFCAVHSYP